MTATAAKPAEAHLKPGDAAPDFTLAGNKPLSLAGFRGKNLVLYFYPKDDTPGCTQEAKDFRDHLKDFESSNTVVVGVSKDSLKSHEAFQQKYCLPFALGSDADGAVCDAYGVWVEKSMYGKTYMGIERTTFLIDGKGIIRHVWRKVKVPNHVSEVLKAAQQL